MRYELIDGDTRIINILVRDGWKIENTFPNPYPQPYFFALMYLHDNMAIEIAKAMGKKTYYSPYDYDMENVREHVYSGKELSPWTKKDTKKDLPNNVFIDDIPF